MQQDLLTTKEGGSSPAKAQVIAAQCGACLKTLLLREGNHRIANSLQLASSVLRLRAREINSAEARSVLDEVAGDIQAIGQMHRRLCQSDLSSPVDLGKYLTDLCSEIQASSIGGNGAKFTYKSKEDKTLYCDSNRTAQIGLIVTELLTNSAKHAGVNPECSVVACEIDGTLEIVVTDNGPGLPENFQLEDWPGIGMKLVRGLATGIQGSIASVPSTSGARFLIKVPLQLQAPV